MKFDNKELENWKKYSISTKLIIMKTIEVNDWGGATKRHEYHFNSEEELNGWLDDYNLGSYETIQEITESIVYEFDWDEYDKQWN